MDDASNLSGVRLTSATALDGRRVGRVGVKGKLDLAVDEFFLGDANALPRAGSAALAIVVGPAVCNFNVLLDFLDGRGVDGVL
jgi:hypothetical protein